MVAVGTTTEVLSTLANTMLSEFDSIVHALPTRFSAVIASASKLLEPKSQMVTLPSATIRNDDEMRQWLDEAERRIHSKLKDGPVII